MFWQRENFVQQNCSGKGEDGRFDKTRWQRKGLNLGKNIKHAGNSSGGSNAGAMRKRRALPKATETTGLTDPDNAIKMGRQGVVG